VCQIVHAETALPPDAYLKEMFERNDDGAGVAWVEDGKVEYSKGYFSFDDFLEALKMIPLPLVAHMRWETHGGVCGELCHPFPITPSSGLALRGNANAVLFHNGVFNTYQRDLRAAILSGKLRTPRGPLSDSRAMAILLGRFGVRILDLLDIGSDRVLIMTPKEITRYGTWGKRDGWWESTPTTVNLGVRIVKKDGTYEDWRAHDWKHHYGGD
jgi:hypothetical protein